MTTIRICLIGMFAALVPAIVQAQPTPGFNVGGYFGPTTTSATSVPQYGAGFSVYTAAWPLNLVHPNGYQSGLIGTWFGNPWKEGYPYSDIEGGLGWWRGGSFYTASPKFGIGGVAPSWSGFTNETGIRGGVYGFVHLSPWLLNPLDQGINLSDDTFGQLFGYGYLALPLTQAKPTTDGINVPTGNHAWTLFLSTANFKGPVGFVPPYFFSHWVASNPKWAGVFLDSQWGHAGTFSMETQTIVSYGAMDGTQTDIRTQPTYFPANGPNNSAILLHRVTDYDQTLWDAVDRWLNKNGSAPTLPFTQGSYTRTIGENSTMGWGFWGPSAAVGGAYSALGKLATDVGGSDLAACKSYNPDPLTWGCQWNPKVTTLTEITNGASVGTVVKFPDYFRSISTTNTNTEVVNWTPIDAGSVPANTGLGEVKFIDGSTHEPLVVDISGSSWTNPGPAAGPFATVLQDGSVVTYYWFRFEDQPAMQNAGLTQEERDQLQTNIVKMHTAWKSDLDFIPPPTVGALAKIDHGLLLTPPQGMEVGYVPIPVRQEWYGRVGNDLQQSTVTQDQQVTVTFTGGSGFWTVPEGVTAVEVLVVGGGGGGGANSGGGGGGGAVVHYENFSVSGSLVVSIGAGGAGGMSGATAPTNGGVSLFGSVVAFGGGSGGSLGSARFGAGAGASGGGGFYQFGNGATSVLPGQGHPGGRSQGGSAGFAGAGGGGAGTPGGDAVDAADGAVGGTGLQAATSGTSSWYGGGGGGGADYQRGGRNGGNGGSAVGGSGGAAAAAQAGTPNTGSGGGGGSNYPNAANGAPGGSGIVIVRYSLPAKLDAGGPATNVDSGASTDHLPHADSSKAEGSSSCTFRPRDAHSSVTRELIILALILLPTRRRRAR